MGLDLELGDDDAADALEFDVLGLNIEVDFCGVDEGDGDHEKSLPAEVENVIGEVVLVVEFDGAGEGFLFGRGIAHLGTFALPRFSGLEGELLSVADAAAVRKVVEGEKWVVEAVVELGHRVDVFQANQFVVADAEVELEFHLVEGAVHLSGAELIRAGFEPIVEAERRAQQRIQVQALAFLPGRRAAALAGGGAAVDDHCQVADREGGLCIDR